MNSQKCVIIDGSNLLWRSIYVPSLWELKNEDGLRTGAVFGFLRSLTLLINEFDRFPLVAFDKGHSAHRVSICPDYKYRESQKLEREHSPEIFKDKDEKLDEYRRQRAEVISILDCLGIPSFLIQGWEGDDIMGYLARYPQCDLIVSEDRDMIQLLDEVDLFMPIKRHYYAIEGKPRVEIDFDRFLEGDEEKKDRLTLKTLKDLEVISTRHYLNMRCISGDASDNIPGVQGVGEVNARKISLKYLTEGQTYLADILDTSKKHSAYEKKFLAQQDAFKLSLELMDLSRVPYPKEVVEKICKIIETSRDIQVDMITFISRIAQSGFKSLRNRSGETAQKLMDMKKRIPVFTPLVDNATI